MIAIVIGNRLDVQTAWQDLIATASEGSILDDTGEGKASILGAVLTSQRLLLVSATLQVLASVSVGSAEAGVTSILWMGPALLFCPSENQVQGGVLLTTTSSPSTPLGRIQQSSSDKVTCHPYPASVVATDELVGLQGSSSCAKRACSFENYISSRPTSPWIPSGHAAI